MPHTLCPPKMKHVSIRPYPFHSGIVYVTLCRYDGKRNALNREVVADATKAFSWVASNPEHANLVVLRSGLPGCFSGGIDLYEIREELAAGGDCRELFEAVSLLFLAIRNCPAYVLGVASGLAVGAGATLLLCCDHALVDASFTISHPERDLQLLPWVSAPHIIRRMLARPGGYETACRYIAGVCMVAEEARAGGLIDEVWSQGRGSFEDHIEAVIADGGYRLCHGDLPKRQFPIPPPIPSAGDGSEADGLIRLCCFHLRGELGLSEYDLALCCADRLCDMARRPGVLEAIYRKLAAMKGRKSG